jgi:hypothetical protein
MVIRYQKRISDLLLDHIDIHIEVPRVGNKKLSINRISKSSDSIRARVHAAISQLQLSGRAYHLFGAQRNLLNWPTVFINISDFANLLSRKTLLLANANLRRTRDLLLPRLVNWEMGWMGYETDERICPNLQRARSAAVRLLHEAVRAIVPLKDVADATLVNDNIKQQYLPLTNKVELLFQAILPDVHANEFGMDRKVIVIIADKKDPLAYYTC